MSVPTVFRYFATLGLHAPYALAILAGVVVTGVLTVAVNPASGLNDSCGTLLFAQMFLASSGFSERARRGHFDPVLIPPARRSITIAVHFVVSVLPGAAGWIVVAVVALLRGSPAADSAIWGAAAGGFFIVSALSWAAGFALSRGTAGFLWTGALVALVVRRADLVSAGSPLSVLFCPFVVLKPGAVDRSVLVVAVLLAALALLLVLRHAARMDIYLLECV